MNGILEKINKIGRDKLIMMALAGIVLIICSRFDSGNNVKKVVDNKSENTTLNDKTEDFNQEDYICDLEIRLENMISSIKGVGDCQVMITMKASTEKILQTDYEKNEKSGTKDNSREVDQKQNTVLSKSGSDQIPYVIKEIMPEIEGVFVVAQGGDNPEVALKINSIIQALFDVEVHKISIVEMK